MAFGLPLAKAGDMWYYSNVIEILPCIGCCKEWEIPLFDFCQSPERRNRMSKRVTELVSVILKPFLEEQGYELYHLEFVKEQKDWYLRVFIEKSPKLFGDWPENVGTDDCEIVSRYLAEKLDESDPIEQNYYLEVSSPGMDRPLLKEIDYVRYRGEQVDVRLYESIGGKKNLFGKLSEHNSETITIEMENGEIITLPREKVSKVKLAIIF